MNKWFNLALNAFLGMIVLNLIVSLIFGGAFVFSIGALLSIGAKLLYIALIVGLVMGLATLFKDLLS